MYPTIYFTWGKRWRYYYRAFQKAGLSEQGSIKLISDIKQLFSWKKSQQRKSRNNRTDSDTYFDNFIDGRGF